MEMESFCDFFPSCASKPYCTEVSEFINLSLPEDILQLHSLFLFIFFHLVKELDVTQLFPIHLDWLGIFEHKIKCNLWRLFICLQKRSWEECHRIFEWFIHQKCSSPLILPELSISKEPQGQTSVCEKKSLIRKRMK